MTAHNQPPSKDTELDDEINKILDWTMLATTEAVVEQAKYGQKINITAELIDKHRDKARKQMKALINQARNELLTEIEGLKDMQIERPFTRSNTSARHARNKLREEKLLPALKEIRDRLLNDLRKDKEA